MKPSRERSAGKPTSRVAPAPRDESDDPFVRELQRCVERCHSAGRTDLLGELMAGLHEILQHPAKQDEPSREDPDA